MTKELSLFDHVLEIGKAHEKTGALPDNGFEPFLELIPSHIKAVCEKLDLNELQTVLFSDLVSVYEGSGIPMRKLAEYINCKPLDIIKYFEDFENIKDRDLIEIDKNYWV